MKLIAYLDFNGEDDEYRYVIKEKSIDITVNPSDNLEQLCKLENIEEPIRDYYRERGYFYREEDIEKYKYDNQRILQIESYDPNVVISDIISFIRNNNLKQFNKIIINLNENQYSEMDQFINQDLPDNIVFKLPDNSYEISYSDYIKTVEAVNNITDNAKDLSPFEQIMYLYDEIRDRVYCEDESNKLSARDISSVLLGDKIVCLGFANMFNIALKKLGINTMKEIIRKNTSTKGHARNIIYIDDPKYNINAILFFDLTYDCKKQNNDDSFFQNYANFARPLSYYKDIERNYNHSETIPFFDLDRDYGFTIINNIKELDDIENHDFLFSMMKIKKLRNHKFDVFSCIDYQTGKVNQKKLKQEYRECFSLLEQEIDPETFAKCLVEVRKKQQELNPDRFQLTFDDIKITIHNRFKPENKEIELLLSIFGEKFFTEEDAREITKKVLGKNNQIPFQKQKS